MTQPNAPVNWPMVATYPLFAYDSWLSYKSFREPKFVSDEHKKAVTSSRLAPEISQALGSGIPGLLFPALLIADNSVGDELWYIPRYALFPLFGARQADIVTPPQLPRARLFAFLLFLAGGWLRVRASQALKRYFKNRAKFVRDPKRNNREGAYKLIRHPSYAGSLAMLYASTLLALTGKTGTKLFGLRATKKGEAATHAIAAAVTYFLGFKQFVEPRIQKEEAALQAKFTSDWHNYSDEVAYRLLPGVY